MSGVFLGNVQAVNVITAPLSPASVAANTSAEQVFPMTQLLAGDVVFVSKPTAQAGLVLGNARVSATGSLAITFGNLTASPIVPTAGEIYTVSIIRPSQVGNNVINY